MRFEDIPHNLVARARSGDQQALEEFCLMAQPGAYAVLLSILRNPDDASDVLQDSMIRAIRFLPTLKEIDALPGWLMRILINQANESFRKSAAPVIDVSAMDEHAAHASVAQSSSAALSPRRSAENHEIHDKINDAIGRLSPRQRTALVLFEMENLSIHEIASILKLTDGAVKFHLHEARKNMRVHLKQLGIQNSSLYEEAPTR